MTRPTKAQLPAKQAEILSIIVRIERRELCDGWGPVWELCDTPEPGDRIWSLAMRNFDRAADALERKGLIVLVNGTSPRATPAGRAVLDAAAKEQGE